VGTIGPVVPDGLVYVVRDIDVVNETGTTGDELSFIGPVLNQLIVIRQGHEMNGFIWSWRGRQIYSVGEQVGVKANVGSWSVTISGYQLTLP
jgi:hypothetical protein